MVLRLPLRNEPAVDVTLLRGGEALAEAVLTSEDGWPECLTDSSGRCSVRRGSYSVVTADHDEAVIEIIGHGMHDVPATPEDATPATVAVALSRDNGGTAPKLLFVAHWSAAGELLAQGLESLGAEPRGPADLRISRHPEAATTSLSAFGYENAWIEWAAAEERVELILVVGEN